MPDTLHPMLADAIGRECRATYRAHGAAVDATGTTRPDAVVGTATGELTLILRDDVPAGIALTTDGGAVLIDCPDLLSLEVSA